MGETNEFDIRKNVLCYPRRPEYNHTRKGALIQREPDKMPYQCTDEGILQGLLQGIFQGIDPGLLQGLGQAEPGPGAGLPRPQLGGEDENRNSDTPKPIPKPRKFEPERLLQDHHLMGNKEKVLEYLDNLGQQGKRLDSTLLSVHRPL